jgi:hypothetical protein
MQRTGAVGPPRGSCQLTDFSNPDERKRWLEAHSYDAAVVLTARAALRTVPELAPRPGNRLTNSGRRTVLEVFRCAAASWYSAAYPGGRETLYSNLLAAALRQTGAFASNRAASSAASTAVGRNWVPTASAALEYALEAGGSSNTKPFQAMLSAVTTDANEIVDREMSPPLLATKPLWFDQQPDWARDRWVRLKRALLGANEDWEVWTDWYDKRLEGEAPNEVIELSRANVPHEMCKFDPVVVNARIKQLVQEHSPPVLEQPGAQNVSPPTAVSDFMPVLDHPVVQAEITRAPAENSQASAVPPQRPAAVEPVWENGILTLPRASATTDLDDQQFAAALRGLSAEIRTFADDIADEANIDRRFVSHLRKLADRIPQGSPTQDELFRLGHIEAVFEGYAETVKEQWPEFLTAQYHALTLHFDRTMRQSPSWREFKRNAAKASLTAQQVADAVPLAKAAATALREEDAQEFVDPDLPQAVERLAESLSVMERAASDSLPEDIVESGKDLLAADLIDSVNNILKRIAEAALTVATPTGAVLSAAGSTLKEASEKYATGAGKGFIRAAKKQGPTDGEKAFKWLRHVAISGGVSAVGWSVGLGHLLEKFPDAFGWLLRLLHL